MRLDPFRRIVLQVLLVPIVALLLGAADLLWRVHDTSAVVTRMEDAEATYGAAVLVQYLLGTEESSLRNYRMTGDVAFLAPYESTQSPLNAAFDQLIEAADGDSKVREPLTRLRALDANWRVRFAEPAIADLRGGASPTDANRDAADARATAEIREAAKQIVNDARERHRDQFITWRSKLRSIAIRICLTALLLGIGIGLFTRDRLHQIRRLHDEFSGALERRTREARDAAERLLITLDAIGDGVISTDAQGCLDHMNPVAERLAGWSREEAAGRLLETVFPLIDPQRRSDQPDPFDQTNHTNEQKLLLRRNGERLAIESTAAPILDGVGGIIGHVFVFRDVTDDLRTQELLVANEKRAVSVRLAASIAHEIHNPLDSVSNILYLLGDPANDLDTDTLDRVELLSIAQQELARVTQISRAMLSLYRESAAARPIDLQELLSGLIALMQPRAQQRRVLLEASLHPTPPVEGFPEELRQVFTHLLANAIEAAGQKGQGHVRVSLDDQSPSACIRIEDDGPGISAELAAQLFQPFISTKTEPGAGLGLWISRGIVQKHEGTLSLMAQREAPGGAVQGTVATVILRTHSSRQTIPPAPAYQLT